MAYKGYVNKEVQAMYGIPLSQLTPKQRKILREDGKRRKKLIDEVQKDFLYNNKKAYEDEAKYEQALAKLYRECQKKILADVTETRAKVEADGGEWSYANQSALTRSKGLFEQINTEITKLGEEEATQLKGFLSEIYTDQFYRTIFTLGQVQGLKGSFNMLNPRLVEATLNYPWSGAMFSDRIWLDKERLGKNLRWGLTQSMILGEGIPEMTKRINNGIETAKYNAERVARTEMKRVCYSSQAQAFAEQGVKEVRYMTAGNGTESNICKVCSAYHDKIFELGKEPTLPIHPNCRCWYVPVVKDTFDDNELNELTGSVRGAENYENWRKMQEAEAKKEETPKVTPAQTKKQDQSLTAPNTGTTINQREQMKLTDYAPEFYGSKAEAKNTQSLMDYINGVHGDGANPETLKLYRSMENLNPFPTEGVTFKITHGKNCAIKTDYKFTHRDSNGVPHYKLNEAKCTIPKLDTAKDIAGAAQTTLHEEMHLIDLMCSDNLTYDGKWYSATDKALRKAFNDTDDVIGSDVKKLFAQHDKEWKDICDEINKKERAERTKLLDKYFPNGTFGAGADYAGYKKANAKLSKQMEEERDYRCRNIMGGGVGNLQDIYDALSGGKHRDSGVVIYGHGSKYYKTKDSDVHETIANYGALSVLRPDLVKLLEDDKPELVNALRGTVRGMLSKVK